MAQLAKFAIIKVRYNAAGTHIEKVMRCPLDANNNVGVEEERTRLQIVDAINNKGFTYMTFIKENGKYKPGAKVRVVAIKGNDWLRTDDNNIEKDNLGNLPTF